MPLIKKGQTYKPGSVFDDHPSRSSIAKWLKRPTYGQWRAATNNALLGLAPNGVYTAVMSPWRRWALTSPFQPYHGLTVSAECFCCTFPTVTCAWCYQAFLPFGARTFLMSKDTRSSGLPWKYYTILYILY